MHRQPDRRTGSADPEFARETKPGGPVRNPSEPAFEGRLQRFISGASTWSLPEPFSKRDWLGALILFLVALGIWYMGDFHTFHYSDDLIHSLNSLYQWTPLSWESDHIGSFLALLVRFIHRPYWNVLAISALSSLLFLGGLTVWTYLLSGRKLTLIEGAVWVLLLLPLVVTKHRIFDNASHGSTFGSAFFFSGLFLLNLQAHLTEQPRVRRLIGLLCTGFLTIYLSKTVFIPLGVLTLLLLLENAKSNYRRWSGREWLGLAVPVICLSLAFVIYEILELTAPSQNDFTLSPATISANLPSLLGNWSTTEITLPALFSIPVLVFFFRPAHPIFDYLAAGVFVETLIISSSKWVAAHRQSGYYLTDLTFLLLLAFILLADQAARSLVRARFHPRWMPILAAAALLLNSRLWNSFSPTPPVTAMDQSIGALTATIVEADCDLILSGDAMEAWPIMLAANDHYYRNHVIDARTSETRTVAAITLRASAVERLWGPRLDWPDVTPCILTGDESGLQRALQRYAPERSLYFIEPRQFGPITSYRLDNPHLTELHLDFDSPAPGEGWSMLLETNPAGETFQWMENTRTTMLLPLATDHDLQVDFRVLYAMSPDILHSLTLTVNDQRIALQPLGEPDAPVVLRAILPHTVLAARPGGSLLIWQVDHTLIPKLTMPPSDDARPLALAFDWLIVR